MKISAFERIRETGVVAILRGIAPEQLDPTLEALYAGGVRCVEITLNTNGALAMIERARTAYDGRMSVGAGTVLEEVSARQAILAGADFVLSPTLSVPMITLCGTYDCLAVPGVFSPTEVITAWQAGARLVKVFPCGSVGPQFIKDLRGPLPQIPMMPVGGVSLENAEEFFRAGSLAIGIGSSLFDPKLAAKGAYEAFAARAEKFLAAAKVRAL